MQSHSGDVRTRVLNALHWDLAVPRNRLKVDIEDGRVTLSGMVDLPYQRNCAECDAKQTADEPGAHAGDDGQHRQREQARMARNDLHAAHSTIAAASYTLSRVNQTFDFF